MRCLHFVSFGVCFGLLVVLFFSGSARADEMSIDNAADSVQESSTVSTVPDEDVEAAPGQDTLRLLAVTNPLAASSVTLDTVNNNVLALRNLFGDSYYWWNNWNFPTDSGVSVPVAFSLRQWLMNDKVQRSYNGVDYDVTTLYGRVKHADELVSDIHRYTEATEINVNNLSDEVGTLKSAVTDIQSRLGGSVEVRQISADDSLRYLPSGSLPWIQSYLTPVLWGICAGLVSFTIGHVWDSFVRLLGLARTR